MAAAWVYLHPGYLSSSTKTKRLLTATIASSERPLVAPRPGVPLELRAVGRGARPRLLLVDGRQTIGSSRRCDLQLSGHGVRPLHCVLTVADGQVRVNRWAAGALLNGNEFVESLLNLGDRLSIGEASLELAVAEFGHAVPEGVGRQEPHDDLSVARTASSEAEPQPPRQPADSHGAASTPVPTHQQFEDRLLARLWTRNVANQSRARAIAERLRATRGASRRLQERLDGLGDELAAAQHELAAARTQIDGLQQQVLDAEQRAAAAQSQATDGAETATAEANRLAEQLTASTQNADELACRVRQLETELAWEAQKLQDAEAALAAAATAAERLAAAETKVDEQQRQIESLQCELEQARDVGALHGQTADESIARLQDALVESHQRADELAGQVEHLESRLTQQSTELAAAVGSLADGGPTAESLAAAEELTARQREELAALEAELREARADAEAASAKARLLQDAHTELQAQLAAARAEAAQAGRDAATTAGVSEAVELQLAELSSERDVAQALVRECEAQIVRLNSELETTREKLLESEAAAVNRLADQAEAERVHQELSAQAQTAESALADAETRARDAEARADQALQTQQELTLRIEQLHDELTQSQRAAAAMAASHELADSMTQTATDESASGADSEDSEFENTADEAIDRLRAAAIWKDETAAPPAEELATPTPASVPASESPSFFEQYRHLLEDDDLADESDRSLERPATSPAPSAPLAGTGDLDDDDAALQAYMENMMRRVRGESNVSSEEFFQPTRPAPSPEPATARPHASSGAATALQESVEPEKLIDLETLKRSTKKPALPADMTAMRELANTSARTAIAKHRNKRLVEAAVGKFTVGAIAIGLAVYLMLSAEWIGTSNFIIGAAIAVVGAWATGTVVAFAISEAAAQMKGARGKDAVDKAGVDRIAGEDQPND